MLEAAMLGIPYAGRMPDFGANGAAPPGSGLFGNAGGAAAQPLSLGVRHTRALRQEQDSAYQASLQVLGIADTARILVCVDVNMCLFHYPVSCCHVVRMSSISKPKHVACPWLLHRPIARRLTQRRGHSGRHNRSRSAWLRQSRRQPWQLQRQSCMQQSPCFSSRVNITSVSLLALLSVFR
jgi:hypothetical protein